MPKCHNRSFISKVLRSRKVLNLRRKRRRNRKIKSRSEPLKKNINFVMTSAIQPEIKIEVQNIKPIRKRFFRCCVPNCSTYGTSEQFVPFPSSDSLVRRIWIDSIPRSNWLICHDTQVCRNHFSNNGNEIVLEIPDIFPQNSFPTVEDKYGRIDKAMFLVSSNYALPETFGELALMPNGDQFIFDFSILTSKYKEQLKMALDECKWLTLESCGRLIFYRLFSDGNCVKVSTSIVIDAQLKTTIALGGIVMDPLDCTRHIPINGRITHWNQLNLMLLDYGYDEVKK